MIISVGVWNRYSWLIRLNHLVYSMFPLILLVPTITSFSHFYWLRFFSLVSFNIVHSPSNWSFHFLESFKFVRLKNTNHSLFSINGLRILFKFIIAANISPNLRSIITHSPPYVNIRTKKAVYLALCDRQIIISDYEDDNARKILFFIILWFLEWNELIVV